MRDKENTVPEVRIQQLKNYPWPMGNETEEELRIQAQFRRERGLSDEPPERNSKVRA